ncbi:MAG TPA: GspH/FimT family pseudopilin [Phycisphaerae bacterium]|nr:GspH/FimT family pseudopilin [Phycisphaerae bacterium]
MERTDIRTPAFSLLELVMVVAIMAVLLAVAQPRMASAIQRDRVRRAATRLAMDIRLAQSEAVGQQQNVTVAFNTDYDAYEVSGLAPEADGSTGYEVCLGADRDYHTNIAAANFKGQLEVTFDRYGAPNNEGSVVLGIGQLRVIIKVAAGTGRVTVGDLRRVLQKLPGPVEALPIDIEYGGAIGGGSVGVDPPSEQPGGGGEIM